MISDPPALMLTSPHYAQFPSRDRRESGTWTGPDLVEGDLAADRVYLVLHGLDGPDMELTGTIDARFNPVAVNAAVVGGDSWESRGVVFSGACWGGLTVDPIPVNLDPREHVIARTVDQAFPLAFLDHGANAVVGFTGAHYVPRGDAGEGVSGAPLHCAFWKNIVDRGWSPSKALFEAKARFIVDTEKRSTDPLAIAKDMKTFWSATCLGLGW